MVERTREYREQLIDEVRRRPLLYATDHALHKDIQARDRAWQDISEIVGIDGAVLKREWKILRDSLRQQVRLQEGRAQQPGVPGFRARGKRCRFRWLDRMAFVIPHMTKRKEERDALMHTLKLESETPSAKTRLESFEGDDDDGDDDVANAIDAEDAAAAPAAASDAACDDDTRSLELFFASACVAARRLPLALRARVQRRLLDALHDAEREARGEGEQY